MDRSLFLSLRRHTSSGLYIPELDGLRFVAIFCVFIYHLNLGVVAASSRANGPSDGNVLNTLAQNLNVGVPLFFAISGMILGLPFARYWLLGGKEVSLKRYFLRRITRLEPPYIISLLLFFMLKRLGHHGTIRDMLPHLAASLAYMHNLIYRDFSVISSVAWSLEVEVQFYILAPVLALIFAVRSARVRRTVLTAVIVAAGLWTPYNVRLHLPTNTAEWMRGISITGNIQYFLVGFLLAELFLLYPPATYRNRRWDLVSMIGWPCLAVALVSAPGFALTALALIILVLYTGVFYGTRTARVCGQLWIASIGGMCYSLYLLHAYTISLLGIVTERIGRGLPYNLRLPLQALMIAPIVLVICTIYYRLVEQPCMYPDWPARLKNRLLAKWSQLTTPSPEMIEDLPGETSLSVD